MADQKYLYNESDSPIRVDDGKGNNRRFPPGASVPVSGDLEKNASGVQGLRAATDDEVKAQNSGVEAGSRDVNRDQALADLDAYARTVTVAVPLNEVIGDDEAPYGPPSGTITTKQAAKRDAASAVEADHFGQHEWLPEDAEKRDLGVVQEAQAQGSGRVEAMTEKVQALGADDTLEVSAEEVKGSAGKPGPGRGDSIQTKRTDKENAQRSKDRQKNQQPKQ